MNTHKPTRDALEILHRRFVEGRPEMVALLEEERANAEIAGLVYQLRSEAGLTQKELAERIGTSHSVISRLEDSDYEGHSLAMLRRIAKALGKKVVLGFVPAEEPARFVDPLAPAEPAPASAE